jgi:hypothetical protein
MFVIIVPSLKMRHNVKRIRKEVSIRPYTSDNVQIILESIRQGLNFHQNFRSLLGFAQRIPTVFGISWTLVDTV